MSDDPERVLASLARAPEDPEAWEEAAVALERGAPPPDWLREPTWRIRLLVVLRSAPERPRVCSLLPRLLGLDPSPPALLGEAWTGITLRDLGGVPFHLASGLPLAARHARTGEELRWIPPTPSPEAPGLRVPGHGLYLSSEPVTVERYGAYLAATGAPPPAFWSHQKLHPRKPAVHVTWTQAEAYCAWMGGRLPLLSESLQGARGWPAPGGARPTNGARPLAPVTPAELMAEAYGGLPEVPGDPEPASAWGLVATSGLVGEWCHDWEHFPPLPEDPAPLVLSNHRVIQGMSWLDSGASSTSRRPGPQRHPLAAAGAGTAASVPAGWHDLETGFRVALPLADPVDLDPTWSPGPAEGP